MHTTTARGLVAFLVLMSAGNVTAVAEVISADLPLLPPGAAANRLETTITARILGLVRSDSETVDITGDVEAELGVSFLPSGEPDAVTTITFTGGRIRFSDISYRLSYGLLGYIDIRGTAISGTLSTPSPPGSVSQGAFDTIEHRLILDTGIVVATPGGAIRQFFDPTTVDLSAQPMETTSAGQGQVAVELDSVEYPMASYTVRISVPIDFDEVMLEDPENGLEGRFAASGVVVAEGQFTRPICSLRADLAGEDCCVDLDDLLVMVAQWLAYADPADCPLIADLDGADCYVGLADVAAIAPEWLTGCGIE